MLPLGDKKRDIKLNKQEQTNHDFFIQSRFELAQTGSVSRKPSGARFPVDGFAARQFHFGR